MTASHVVRDVFYFGSFPHTHRPRVVWNRCLQCFFLLVQLFQLIQNLLGIVAPRIVWGGKRAKLFKQQLTQLIKTGVGPVLVDLMERGFVSAIATNGAGVIHDVEIALVGHTSEDVDEALGPGRFGMAEETGRLLNEAINHGARDDLGLGEAVGRMLVAMKPEFAAYSLLHEAYKNKFPVTVHATIGTDIIHLHPNAHGASIGKTSHQDFRLLTAIVKELDGGGVYLNIGSAVTLPEVFLKAITVVRNSGGPLQNFTTANFDFIQHYRPNTNVVKRPVANGAGKGYSLTGHHELMIPLLAAAVINCA